MPSDTARLQWAHLRHNTRLLVTCTYCGARPGKRCKTKNGHNVSLHAARIDLIRSAYNLGYAVGMGAK